MMSVTPGTGRGTKELSTIGDEEEADEAEVEEEVHDAVMGGVTALARAAAWKASSAVVR